MEIKLIWLIPMNNVSPLENWPILIFVWAAIRFVIGCN